MEWVDGVRLRSASRQRRAPGGGGGAAGGSGDDDGEDAAAAEDLRLVEVGVRCSLEQMLEEVPGGGGSVKPAGGGFRRAEGTALFRVSAWPVERFASANPVVFCPFPTPQGFYHADPHPGNLLKTPDGRLAYLDFGG
jgi:hypothetical protein